MFCLITRTPLEPAACRWCRPIRRSMDSLSGDGGPDNCLSLTSWRTTARG